jgi:hypothetical protein
VVVHVEAPTAPPPPIDSVTDRRRRRWPRRLGIALAIIVGLVTLAAGTWIANYDPLAQGSFGYGPPAGVRSKAYDLTWAISDAPVVYKLSAALGMSFTYRFSITNDGPTAVTIDDVGTPATHSEMVVTRRPVALMVDQWAGPTRSGWIPFRPFTLRPGQEAAIEMRVQADTSCFLAPDSTMSWNDEQIRYKVFGFTRHADFVPNIEIVLVGNRSTDCSSTSS